MASFVSDHRHQDFTIRWPIEIWLHVFSITYPVQLWDPRIGFWGFLSLSWVCSRWRQAMIGHKQMWSIIVLDRPSELVELYLQRSVDYPLHVFFNSDQGEPDFIDEERHVIQRNLRQVFGDAFNMSRIKRVDLTVLDTSLNVVLDEYISQHEAAILETFIYTTENYGLRRQPAFGRAFGGVSPPRLRSLALCGDRIPIDSPILSSTLVELTLDAVDLGAADCIFLVLKALPSLERLTLINSLVNLRYTSAPFDQAVVLPNLRMLEVGDEALALDNFLQHVRFPQLRDLHVSVMHEALGTSLPFIQSGMVMVFETVERAFAPEVENLSPSYDELRVRFGVIYSHLEFVLSGGHAGLPQNLQFSFHDTDELVDESQSDEDDPNPSVALVRYGLQNMPFVSRLQSLIMGPIVDFEHVNDWVDALQSIPRIQAVPCIGSDGAAITAGLIQALRVRPALFARLTRVRIGNIGASPAELELRLARIALDAGAPEGGPLELLLEGDQCMEPETVERLRRVTRATSVRIVKG